MGLGSYGLKLWEIVFPFLLTNIREPNILCVSEHLTEPVNRARCSGSPLWSFVMDLHKLVGQVLWLRVMTLVPLNRQNTDTIVVM